MTEHDRQILTRKVRRKLKVLSKNSRLSALGRDIDICPIYLSKVGSGAIRQPGDDKLLVISECLGIKV